MNIQEEKLDICRTLFPALDQMTYLDTGSAGLGFSKQGAATAEFYSKHKALGYVGRDKWQAKATKVRGDLAEMLKVSESEIEFYSGTTDALNIVAHSITWSDGDEIVFADDEFPSVQLAWTGAVQRGAVTRPVKIEDESSRMQSLIDAMTDCTRVVSVALVHSATGTKLDLDTLGTACRERDILLVVDGIHALGATPINLEKVDIFMSGFFKWMLSGFGISVCVIKDRARARMTPAFRGYLNQKPEDGFQFAHINYPGLYAIDEAITLMRDTIGWETIYARTDALVEWLAQDLASAGIELVSPPGQRAGLASFPISDSERARDTLAKQQIFAAAKGPYMRATPFFYNSRADISRFTDAVLRDCL